MNSTERDRASLALAVLYEQHREVFEDLARRGERQAFHDLAEALGVEPAMEVACWARAGGAVGWLEIKAARR